MSKEALQITLPDRRKFLTDKSNKPLLQEFAKTFDARMAVVRADDASEVLRLPDLARAVCQQGRVEGPRKPVGRQAVIARANEVRTAIRRTLLNRIPLKTADMAQRYGLSRSTISTHIAAVRKQLDHEGIVVSRTGGEYRLDG